LQTVVTVAVVVCVAGCWCVPGENKPQSVARPFTIFADEPSSGCDGCVSQLSLVLVIIHCK